MANDDEPSEQDYYRKRVHDIILKHGVGSTEFSKIIKEIEKKTSEARRTICMHSVSYTHLTLPTILLV